MLTNKYIKHRDSKNIGDFVFSHVLFQQALIYISLQALAFCMVQVCVVKWPAYPRCTALSTKGYLLIYMFTQMPGLQHGTIHDASTPMEVGINNTVAPSTHRMYL